MLELTKLKLEVVALKMQIVNQGNTINQLIGNELQVELSTLQAQAKAEDAVEAQSQPTE